MAKKTTSYNVLLIGVLGLLAVGTWAIFDVYRGLTATTLTEIQQSQLQPLRVEVGPELIAALRARRQFDELFLNSVESRPVPLQERGTPVSTTSAQPSPTPTITVTPSPTASPSSSTEEATASGSI